MSFLLRNNRRNKNSNPVGTVPRRPAFGSDRRIIPEPRNPSSLRNKNQHNTNAQSSFDYGNQVQVQRTVQVQRPSVSTKHATATVQQQQQDPGVITMSEVLEDLRVLEMQQRDSQRKLTNAQITKQNRVQQQATLEVQLEQTKYANGELRAQIRQFREFLSCGTRELGTRRLAGSRSGDDIKAFEQQLKRGLQAQRTNTTLVRKISSLIIGLQNKEAILQRLNAESKEKFALLEKDCLDAKLAEEKLRKSVQNEVSRAHKIADEVTQIRSKSSALEEELLSAQSSEESTRLRVQAIDGELESEAKRHTDAMNEMQSQIQKYEQETLTSEAENKEFASQMEKLSKELLEHKKGVVAIQEKEGHALSSYSNDFQEAIPSLEKKKFSAILEKVQSSASTKKSENEELRAKLDSIRASIQQSKEDAQKSHDQAKSLTDSARCEEVTQKTRSDAVSTFQQELEKERSEVVELRKSSLELQEEQSKESTENSGRLVKIDGDIKKDKDTVESLSNQITAIADSEKILEEAFESESSDLNCRLKAKKEAIQSLDIEFARTETEEKTTNKEFEKNHEAELQRTEEKRLAHLEQVVAERTKLFKQYPSLKDIVVQYDHSRTMEDQAQEALHSLTEALEAKIDATARAREGREKEKRDAIRKAAEAEAAVRRKEERRRENREKRLAEIQREEEAERPRTESSIDALFAEVEEQGDDETIDSKRGSESSLVGRSKTRSKKKKKRKDADFYDPFEESALSDTETSPAEPKLLFPQYEAEDYSLSTYNSTMQTQDSEKRVRWKDQDRLSQDASAKSRSKPSVRQSRRYGSSTQSMSSASTKASNSRTSRSSKSSATRASPKLDHYDDLLNSESVEDTASKRSSSTKSSTSRTSRSSKSNASRTSPKLDHYDDLLNSESIDDATSKRSTKPSTSHTFRFNKPSTSHTSPKLDHYDDLLNSESIDDEVSKRSTKPSTSRSSRSSKSSKTRTSSKQKNYVNLLNSGSFEDTATSVVEDGPNSTESKDELDKYLPSKEKSLDMPQDYTLDGSSEGDSWKAQIKSAEKTFRRRSISSKREEKSHFDSLMAVPDVSDRRSHSSATKRRKRKKSSTEPRSRDDFASIELGVDDEPKKIHRDDRSPYRNEIDVGASLESGSTKSRTKTKKHGSDKSNDEISKKSPKDRKIERDPQSRSSTHDFGDGDAYKSRWKEVKEDGGEKVSHRRKSSEKPHSTSSSSQPIDTETGKSHSSRLSKGRIKSKVSTSSIGRSISSDSKSKRSKDATTVSRASSSRSRKAPTGSKTTDGSKKRKLSSISTSQVSDATGRSQKARRRKKETAASSKTASKSSAVVGGSYDFHF
ncbi:unnamed protein product [Cylindrotheca closterium]|uniref:Uncharacterized protein n=1 Tax=Cylindrotheca closterium TaxID=2856 RepID=A0AAD2PWM0_9STRA|nr:unnamed protein product [Cylindrotheca closterium]